jgi:pimeloyl-ACP methyl ester carboxylesterase
MPFIHISDRSIFYDAHGKGEAILLLQGNTVSSQIFHDTGDIQFFSRNNIVFTLDFCGTGKSSRMQEWPIDWYAQSAADAYEVLKHNNITAVNVIGSSGGALIGFWLAIYHPEMIKSLVADSFGLDYANQMQDVVRNTRMNYSPGQIEFWKHCHGTDWQQVVEADTDFILRYAAAQSGSQVDIPLEKIQCPVLITGSRMDDLIPNIVEQAEISARRLPNVEIYLHPQGNHPLMWSKARVFREQVEQFWN